ncbi:hypothetical protein D3870_19700 [Noviherbaspirillum cavernae]|uniref:Uncharacterized protein n=1 Tax=Noviherbaspirillum cavernae TaxID=2320862 RepID=A0A418WVE3_9BURK|nr:hypothetical protein D3870_19700 [Noviherbaspirillum cavernae]
MTACGGGGPLDETELAAAGPQASAAAAVAARAPKPSDTFGNFNPDIWNQHDWYECNCARNPETTQPASTPWAAAN